MKKISFLLLIFASFFLYSSNIFAQTANSCSSITAANYNTCCKGDSTTVLPFGCSRYLNSTSANPTSTMPVFGTIGSVQTTPINSSNNESRASIQLTNPDFASSELSSCSAVNFGSLFDILIWVKCIITTAIIPLIFVVAFMFFLWGVFKFIYTSDLKKKEEGKKIILAGMIGLFVMVSLWGIVKIVGNTLGIDSTAVPLLQTEYLKK